MNRRSWISLSVIALASGAAWGCGGEEDGSVERSETAVKADRNMQDAMRGYMQSKKGGKKGAAKAEEPKAEEPKAEEPKAEEPKAE